MVAPTPLPSGTLVPFSISSCLVVSRLWGCLTFLLAKCVTQIYKSAPQLPPRRRKEGPHCDVAMAKVSPASLEMLKSGQPWFTTQKLEVDKREKSPVSYRNRGPACIRLCTPSQTPSPPWTQQNNNLLLTSASAFQLNTHFQIIVLDSQGAKSRELSRFAVSSPPHDHVA